MANGSGSIQCNNCWHYKYSETGRNCKKYDFVFPKISYEILCRDYRSNFVWRTFTDPRAFIAALILGIPAFVLYIFTGGWLDQYKEKRKRKELQPYVLYFYSDQSRRPMQPLAPFTDLQSLLFVKHVAVKFDPGYGFSIHLDPSAITEIPDLGKDIEIDIEGKKFRFGVKGSFNILYCKEIPSDVKTVTYRDSALLLAQAELKKYKIIPNHIF